VARTLGCSGVHGTIEVRGLRGAMGVLEDAEGGWGGELPHTGEVAACSACQAGYVKDQTNNECKPCGTGCSACSAGDQSQCAACLEGKYLDGNTCIADSACGTGKYADPITGKCELCTAGSGASVTNGLAGVAECTVCMYDEAKGKLKCAACGSKIPRVALDGTSTCVEKNYAGCAGQDNTLFILEDNSKCLLCGDTETGTDPKDQGIAGCKTCTKTSSAKPTCTACLEGYIENTSSGYTCDKCDDTCKTCSIKTDPTKCDSCYPGYFLVTESTNKKCVPCGDTAKGGIDGCAECTNEGSLKCTKCKPNRKSKGDSGNYTCEEKTCEDPTACGGTAGSCGAIVVGSDGNMKYYCSYCGESTKFPIDGICNSAKGSNTCDQGVCTSCTTGYFLYMGSCYKVDTAPGSLMCSKASTTAGVCDTPNANSRYFAVPGQQTMTRTCRNPLSVPR
ncbi:Variant-specific surface protein, partial [Giardia duodenalis]